MVPNSKSPNSRAGRRATIRYLSKFNRKFTDEVYHLNFSYFSTYPEYNWQLWRFKEIPKGTWASLHTQRQFLDQLASTFGIQRYITQYNIQQKCSMEDWYSIEQRDILKHKGRGLLSYYGGSLSKALRAVYPGTRKAKYHTQNITGPIFVMNQSHLVE